MKEQTKNFWMLFCVLALLLTGCTSNQSTIKFVNLTEQEKNIALTTGDAFGIWDFSLQGDIQGIALSIDVWEHGICTESNLFYNGDASNTKTLYLSLKTEYQDQRADTQWQWLRDMGDGFAKASPTLLSVPLTDTYAGYSYDFWNYEEPMLLEPGESYLLAVQNFDLHGDGLQGANCGNFKERDSSFDTAAYVVTLRLQTFAAAEEAETIGNGPAKTALSEQ